MEIKRIHENGKYAGSITTYNNGDRVRRDSHGNVSLRYDASNGQIRDSHGHLIRK